MKIKHGNAKLPASLHFIYERTSGFLQGGLLRMTQVDQIGVMGKNPAWPESQITAICFKRIDVFAGQGFGLPLPLIFSKHCKTGCPDFPGIDRRVLNAACCTHMGPYIFQVILLFWALHDNGSLKDYAQVIFRISHKISDPISLKKTGQSEHPA